jgi:hypothetical protein
VTDSDDVFCGELVPLVQAQPVGDEYAVPIIRANNKLSDRCYYVAPEGANRERTREL